MKKLISVFLVLLLCVSLTVSALAADTGFVFDEADLLSSAEESELSAKLQQVSQTYNAQVVVVTVASSAGADVDSLVNTVYDDNGFGYGADYDGVLLLVCMDPREYRILSNGFAADAITGSDIDSIGNLIVSDLSDGNYAAAFSWFAEECEYYLDGFVNGFPFPFVTNLLIALVVGLIIGLIVALVLKGQLKSVYKQDRANNYVKAGSMQVTAHSDLFLYRNITRRKKETNNSSRSGSSGSSRNVGGGSF